MRGDKEKECLSSITEINSQKCYGLSITDIDELRVYIETALPNPEPSKFPDFIFSKGFIEHFQVTSSKTTKKGSDQEIKYSGFRKSMDKDIQLLKDELDENPSYELKSVSKVFMSPPHTYEYLKSSFVNHWKNHIESLNDYLGNKEVGIFLIDYKELELSMYECKYTSAHDGLSLGDYPNNETIRGYRLSRDKELLKFIYEYKSQIQFVIYKCFNGYEIIKVESVPALISLMPWDYLVYSLCTMHQETFSGSKV